MFCTCASGHGSENPFNNKGQDTEDAHDIGDNPNDQHSDGKDEVDDEEGENDQFLKTFYHTDE